ncbi:MAG: MFS transporter, partial [Sulfitobacter sp.]
FLALVWAAFGFTSTLVLTPGALVITRSVAREGRAAVFAAQFSLSHAGWLVAYPLAGWLATWLSLEATLLCLSVVCAAVVGIAALVWPADDPAEQAHTHSDLPDNHPHLIQNPAIGPDHRHSHIYHIDLLHPKWPARTDRDR